MKPMTNRLPTGKGSRGGTDPGYWRAWRAAHPEYREREKVRRRHAKWLAAEARVDATLTGVLLDLIAADVASSSLGAVADRLGLDLTTVLQWLTADRVMSGEDVDAVVATYGFDRMIVAFRSARRRLRDARDGGSS